jgi:NAD(P)-dependent dehydrogenase (short-subunit alcohol dehydrogenase family)
VVDDGSALAEAVANRVAQGGQQVHVLRLPGVPPHVAGAQDHTVAGWDPTELENRVKAITATGISLVIDVHAATQPDWATGVSRLRHALLLAKNTVGALTKASEAGRAAFITVTRLDGKFGLGGVAENDLPSGGVGGMIKTLAIEAPSVFCRAIDIAPSVAVEAAAGLVIDEAADVITDPAQVGHDGQQRVGLTLADEPLTTPDAACAPLTSQDVLVVTGGGRGITAACVIELAQRYQPKLVLLGRTPLEDEPDWAKGVEDAGLKAAAAAGLKATGEKPTPRKVERLYKGVLGIREIRQTLQALRDAGSQADYVAADIADPAATAAALAPYQGSITGLVHGAGVLADQLIANKKAAEIDQVWAPKLTGLRSVISALQAGSLRHIVLFSSVAGFFGNLGQSDYAMANEVLNAWASSWKQAHPGTRITSINWGAWDSGMVNETIRAIFAERGITLIPVPTGARMFAEQFAPERAHDVVTVLGPTTPLSTREPAQPTAAVTTERRVNELPFELTLADHAIGGTPVLPATMALGWTIGAVERLTRREVRQVRDFAVHKGVVFDGTQPGSCQMVISPADGRWDVAIRSARPNGLARPHYAASVVSAASAPVAPVTGLPPLGGGRDAAICYTDGTLFHGPSLQGIRRVLSEEEPRLVLECQLSEHRPAGGAFAGSLFAPGTADLLLQAGLVWVRLFRGSAGLPASVARVDLFEPLPDGQPFLVIAEPSSAASNSGANLDITACAPDGRVLTRFGGAVIVADPQLAAKFASR